MSEDAGIDIDYSTDAELASIQAKSAEVPVEIQVSNISNSRTIEFKGRKFRLADKVGLMPILKFSAAANLDIEDQQALAAMYAMLRDCIYSGQPACGECDQCEAKQDCPSAEEGDWVAFESHAMQTRADVDEMLDFMNKAMEVISGRPPEPPATSSNGRQNSRAGSTGISSGRRGRASKR